MNLEQARFNMIESQIRTWDVLDQTVLDALDTVKRETFVPLAYRELAFADMQLPLGHGEVMLTPKLEARMLQELNLQPNDRVLEIGTGSGYVTALLCYLVRHVVTVELIAEFSSAASAKLNAAGFGNVTLEVGDGANGWERAGPYDAILLTGSITALPDAFRNQLTIGGRLLAVIGEEPVMTATLVSRVTASDYTRQSLFETNIPPLRNFPPVRHFVL